MKEEDPNGLYQHDPGAKLDAGKIQASLLEDFSLALLEVAKVLTHGAEKYTAGGWQHVQNGVKRYNDAAWRHRLAARHEELDSDSGLSHDAHEAWNVLAKLELKLRKKEQFVDVSREEVKRTLSDLRCGRLSSDDNEIKEPPY